jgi:hypothetical protein
MAKISRPRAPRGRDGAMVFIFSRNAAISLLSEAVSGTRPWLPATGGFFSDVIVPAPSATQ